MLFVANMCGNERGQDKGKQQSGEEVRIKHGFPNLQSLSLSFGLLGLSSLIFLLVEASRNWIQPFDCLWLVWSPVDY